VNGTTASAYADTFNRVFDYIDTHLGEDLSVERLSRVANFSKFHFHRQFAGYAGISAFRYIQLQKLKRASYRLAFDSQSRIIDIAIEAGFESPEAFSRAFKSAFGQTPSEFRKAPAWQPWQERFLLPKRERSVSVEVSIVNFAETPVAVLEHRGAPERINDSIRTFIEWRKTSGLSPVATSKTLGLAYTDPESGDPDGYGHDICGTVAGPVPPNPQGVINKVIPAGRCAVLRHVGSHDTLRDSAAYLYREWLPASGEALRDFPLMFHYVARMPAVPEHEMITDIYLPLT
jgi:AraC family transcriptional regulator